MLRDEFGTRIRPMGLAENPEKLHDTPRGWETRTVFSSSVGCQHLQRGCEALYDAERALGGGLIVARYSLMNPGTIVKEHRSGQNFRLKLHLGLVVPAGARLHFRRHSFAWEEGKVTVLDDFYSHRVFALRSDICN